VSETTKQIAGQFIDLFYLEGDPAQIERLFEKVLAAAHAAGATEERAKIRAAIAVEAEKWRTISGQGTDGVVRERAGHYEDMCQSILNWLDKSKE